MNPKQFAVLIVFAGVVAELPAQQPHCHEDFGYSPPTLFNFASPSITGNTYTEGFYDGVVVASLPAASISVGVEEPPPNTPPRIARTDYCSPRTSTGTRRQFFRNFAPRKTIPRS